MKVEPSAPSAVIFDVTDAEEPMASMMASGFNVSLPFVRAMTFPQSTPSSVHRTKFVALLTEKLSSPSTAISAPSALMTSIPFGLKRVDGFTSAINLLICVLLFLNTQKKGATLWLHYNLSTIKK